MKALTAVEFLACYDQIMNKQVVIILKNRTTITGEITGYFKNDDDTIWQWHVSSGTFGVDTCGYPEEILIKHSEIDHILFNHP